MITHKREKVCEVKVIYTTIIIIIIIAVSIIIAVTTTTTIIIITMLGENNSISIRGIKSIKECIANQRSLLHVVHHPLQYLSSSHANFSKKIRFFFKSESQCRNVESMHQRRKGGLSEDYTHNFK